MVRAVYSESSEASHLLCVKHEEKQRNGFSHQLLCVEGQGFELKALLVLEVFSEHSSLCDDHSPSEAGVSRRRLPHVR